MSEACGASTALMRGPIIAPALVAAFFASESSTPRRLMPTLLDYADDAGGAVDGEEALIYAMPRRFSFMMRA